MSGAVASLPKTEGGLGLIGIKEEHCALTGGLNNAVGGSE